MSPGKTGAGTTAVSVPSAEEFAALEARVTGLEGRVTALEGEGGTPPPTGGSGGYTDSGPITATSGQTITKVRIRGCSGTAITVRNVSNVTINDVQIEETGGHGVFISNAHGVKVVNSLIRTERTGTTLDTQNGICIRDDSYDVLIQGNVFKNCESSVHVSGGHSVTMRGNYSEYPKGPFPRGQHFQAYPCNQKGPDGKGPLVEGNYFVSESGDEDIKDKVGVEDAINVGDESGYPRIYDNYVIGGRAYSGCGVVMESTTQHGHVKGNTLIRTSQQGVNIVESAFCTVEGNKVLDTNLSAEDPNLGNLGLGAWYHSGDTRCHDNVFKDNIVSNKLASGSYNDVWIKSGGGVQENNTKGSTARGLLTPEAEKLPPPSAKGVAPIPWVAR